MKMEEVYRKQHEIQLKVKELQQEASQYDHYILEHFEKLMKDKVSKEKMKMEYDKIPESYIKFKVFSVMDKEGYF